MTPMQIRVGDVARMKKQHPCGSLEWRVTRVGADIGMKCLGCGRRVMLPRDEFERRVKSLHESADGDSNAES